MEKIFTGIKSVGFDIDNTMYSSSEEIDKIVQIEIAKKILEKKPELRKIENAIELSERRYSDTGSRSILLKEIGYTNPGDVLYDCLANANIVSLINRDDKLQNVLEKIAKRYELFLITNNPEDMSKQKLEKLGVDISLFEIKCYGDTIPGIKKADGSLFKYFLKHSIYEPSQHLYIGDSRKGDIIPAKVLGIKTLAVGSEIPEADFSIKNIHDIEKILL